MAPPLPLADLTLTGTTSAGKSTLANAIIGSWLFAFGVQETTRGTIDIAIGDPPARDRRPALPAPALLLGEAGDVQEHRMSRVRRGVLARLAVPGFRVARSRRELRLRDTPGVLSAADDARLDAVRRAAAASRVVAILLGAEDTNVMKKRALVRAVLDATRGSSARLVWIVSRADSFLRDRGPHDALAGHRREMSTLIAQAGGGVDPAGTQLLPVACRAAFLAVVLSGGARRTGPDAANLWRWARDEFAAFGLGQRFGRTDPMSWPRHRQLRALRALWNASGAAAFDRAVLLALRAPRRDGHG